MSGNRPALSQSLAATEEQLLLDLFNSEPNALATPFAHWVATSKLFTAFAHKYQPKIRKKIRMSRDAEERYNLYCELRTAYILLQEPKFDVAYEPLAKGQGRCADFAVTYRRNTTFHVEVTRLRISQQEQQLMQQEDANPGSDFDEQFESIRRYESRRLADVVCDKFGQFSPETPNVLWVWGESQVMQELEIGRVMIDLKRRAEQRDAGLFARHGFEKPADFIRYYQRVSAILIQNPHGQVANRPLSWWQNNDTRHPFPSRVTHLLPSLIQADTSPAM